MTGTMLDAHARAVRYLRVSLTERCNLRCTYCIPAHHEELPSDWMTDDEIVALVAALVPMGLTHVRLTGGEPTLRPRLPALVARLAKLSLRDLSLTTNATRLVALAQPLYDAGLTRINVSLDTLRAERFSALTGGELAPVLAGIEAAMIFAQRKLNIVALRGVNDDELPALAEFAWSRGFLPRFIELMPMSEGHVAPASQFLPIAEVRAKLGPMKRALPNQAGIGPARYASMGSEGRGNQVGFISAVTEPFCETCNRIRVSARGRLHTCLGIDDPLSTPDPLDLRAALRRGPDELRNALTAALLKKSGGHTFVAPDQNVGPSHGPTGGPRRHMVVLGG